MMMNTALGHMMIKVHPIPWMDGSADEDYHGRDIGVDDTEASNLPGQYWLSKTTGQVVSDGDVRICSSLLDRYEFVRSKLYGCACVRCG